LQLIFVLITILTRLTRKGNSHEYCIINLFLYHVRKCGKTFSFYD